MIVDYEELKQLISVRGPPGDEYEVADVFSELVEPHVDTVTQDDLGNVIATDEGDADEPEILIAAHTDELAFLITDITEDGFLRFSRLGAHYTGNLPGQRVRVGPDGVLGVIGPKSRHRMDDSEATSLPDDLSIDVGAPTESAARDLNVREGDYATWDREVDRLSHGRVTGRAIDDRIGLAVVLAVARTANTEATVHYVATVQEEPGLRGAQMTAYDLDPDIAIAVDIFPGDHPGADDEFSAKLDGGPAVEMAEGVDARSLSGALVNRQTQKWFRTAGTAADIDIQWSVFLGGLTDAKEFQRIRGGRHTGVVSVPCRYTHSPVETISMDDANEAAKLLTEALSTPFPPREAAMDRRPDRSV